MRRIARIASRSDVDEEDDDDEEEERRLREAGLAAEVVEQQRMNPVEKARLLLGAVAVKWIRYFSGCEATVHILIASIVVALFS